MRVTVKLFASFRTGRFAIEDRNYPEGTSVGNIVGELGIPQEELGIVMVNSRHVHPAYVLGEGDTLALFPLLGGG
jgi:sulfur-carrier protein